MADRMLSIRKEKASKDGEDEGLSLEIEKILDSPTKDDNVGKKTGKKSSTKSSRSTASAGKGKRPATSSSSATPITSKAGVVSDKQVPSSSHSTDSNNNILAILNTIQENQKKQNDTINSLSDRIQAFESYENEYDEEGDYYKNQDEGDDYEEIETEPPSKKQKKDDNESSTSQPSTSRFSSLSKRFKIQEVCDKKIDDVLATNITDLFRNGMDEQQYQELTKNDNNARPENCEGSSVVRTNQLIWNVISPEAQTADKKMQFIEKSVIKASTILAKTVNDMALKENDEASEMSDYIDKCNDVLALLGHANRQINLTRREFLKPELRSEYLHLCSPSVPYTSNLFGDDVSKTAKDIEDCSKVGNKIRFGFGFGFGYGRGRGRGGFRGRGGTRGRGRGRGARGRGHPNIPPKNSSRGGNHHTSQKEKN